MNLDKSPTADLEAELTAAETRIEKQDKVLAAILAAGRAEQDRAQLAELTLLACVERAQSAEAEAARLREALEPFAKLADYFDGATTPMPDSLALNHGVTLGDCRRARQALHPIHKETT